ncbi:cysteine hydrolase [Vibrio albus]|uniref:Cysteine hydrolase n=1 Tax=Vibrio albus TaxID=2200953 RepID=A0A2U3B757_9VIBR|nr:cysteine hydrolase family protein [Vibrio albus]PWI32555.1 cysteine hydrolase [Vibrio albus]
MNKQALLIIDIQNDYFPGGNYPLWNTEETLNNIKTAIRKADTKRIPIILVQHIADPSKGIAPFFNQGSEGVNIHADILAACPEAKVVKKSYADSFKDTLLEPTLSEFDIDELLICGMMTQNCVTHTAISPEAEKYTVSIITDCCTTVDQMIHSIGLNAVSTRVPLVTLDKVL